MLFVSAIKTMASTFCGLLPVFPRSALHLTVVCLTYLKKDKGTCIPFMRETV